MDLNMPVLDGWEATKYIRSELKLNIPIMAMTANFSITDQKECFDIGMNDFVSKPFKIEILLNKISKLCSKKKSSHY